MSDRVKLYLVHYLLDQMEECASKIKQLNNKFQKEVAHHVRQS